MKTNLNLPIGKLSREQLGKIKVICFDGDGDRVAFVHDDGNPLTAEEAAEVEERLRALGYLG